MHGNLICPVLQIQLITEVRNIIRGEDLEQFNEMTIHKEIEARSVSSSLSLFLLIVSVLS